MCQYGDVISKSHYQHTALLLFIANPNANLVLEPDPNHYSSTNISSPYHSRDTQDNAESKQWPTDDVPPANKRTSIVPTHNKNPERQSSTPERQSLTLRYDDCHIKTHPKS